jgi:hypothetical protein
MSQEKKMTNKYLVRFFSVKQPDDVFRYSSLIQRDGRAMIKELRG